MSGCVVVLAASAIAATGIEASASPVGVVRLQAHAMSNGRQGFPAADGRTVTIPGTVGVPWKFRNDDTGVTRVAPAGCRSDGTAGDFAALVCPAVPSYAVLDLLSGRTTDFASLNGAVPTSDFGRRWALVFEPSGGTAYVDWRTGKRRAAVLEGGAPTQNSDTDDLSPLPRLISGDLLLGIPSRRAAVPAQRLQSLRLMVGHTVRVLRRRCRGALGCVNMTVSRGLVSWNEGSAQYVYVTRTDRLYRLALPEEELTRLTVVSNSLLVTHTANHVYVGGRRENDVVGPTDDRQWVGFSARVPG